MCRFLFLISSSPSFFQSPISIARIVISPSSEDSTFLNSRLSSMPISSNSPFRLRTSASANRPLDFFSYILSTLVRRIVLNTHGIRSFVCSMDNMRKIRIHHGPCFLRERDGFPPDRICIHVSNPSKRVRALSRTLTHQHLDYILLFMYGTFTCPGMYSSVYQRPPKATFTS